MHVHVEARGVGYPGAGVIDSCEKPSVGSRKGTF